MADDVQKAVDVAWERLLEEGSALYDALETFIGERANSRDVVTVAAMSFALRLASAAFDRGMEKALVSPPDAAQRRDCLQAIAARIREKRTTRAQDGAH